MDSNGNCDNAVSKEIMDQNLENQKLSQPIFCCMERGRSMSFLKGDVDDNAFDSIAASSLSSSNEIHKNLISEDGSSRSSEADSMVQEEKLHADIVTSGIDVVTTSDYNNLGDDQIEFRSETEDNSVTEKEVCDICEDDEHDLEHEENVSNASKNRDKLSPLNSDYYPQSMSNKSSLKATPIGDHDSILYNTRG